MIMADYPNEGEAMAVSNVLSSGGTNSIASKTTTDTTHVSESNNGNIARDSQEQFLELLRQQQSDQKEMESRSDRRANSDKILKTSFDEFYSSQPVLSISPSALTNDYENNQNGTASSSRLMMKETSADSFQQQKDQEETTAGSKQQRVGRSRRSNSDIPMAVLEHGPYISTIYPPLPPYYSGGIHLSGPSTYGATWGYGNPTPPPHHPHQFYHQHPIHQGQSLGSSNGSVSGSASSTTQQDPNIVGRSSIRGNAQHLEQQRPSPPHPQKIITYHDTFQNNLYYPTTTPSQQPHPPPPSHMLMMPPQHANESTPPPPPPYHQQHHHQQQQEMMLQRSEGIRRPTNPGRLPSQDNQRRKSKSHHRHHRKSLSSSMNAAEYGSFFNGLQQEQATELNNDVPIVVRSVGRGNESKSSRFSPRNDLRKMFQELSPQQSSRKTLDLGGFNNNNMNGGNARHMVPPSPRPYPSPPFMTSNTSSSMRHPSPPFMTSNNTSSMPVNALYKGVPSRESTRKRQSRHYSAQMLMESIKGVEQPLRCRNVAFLLLFVFHLLLVGVYLGEEFAKEAFIAHYDDPDTVTIYYRNLLFITILSGSFAVLSSVMLFCAMTIFARHFLQIALMIIITISFVWGTLGIGLSPKTIVPVTGIIALGLAVAYTFIVWDRIPFSASNLLCALSGIKTYPTTIVFAIFMQIFTMCWCIYASVIGSGLYNAIQVGKVHLSHDVAIMIYALIVFSVYWTAQVLHGCVEAATAGIIYGWWHSPGYSNQVLDSVSKTLFYSMGSICFGGLVVGPVWIIHQLSIFIRPGQRQPLLLFHRCLHFIQACLSNAVDYATIRCNEYSFTYVGMYHYGFLEAGKNAHNLFEKRGWTAIVADDLIPNVLFLTSLVMGGLTGCFAYATAQIYDLSLTSLPDPGIASFVLGAGLGLIVNSILFSVVSSSVNTVLVCYASSPVDFDKNHPELSAETRAAWREVWPNALDIINTMSYQHQLPYTLCEHDEDHHRDDENDEGRPLVRIS